MVDFLLCKIRKLIGNNDNSEDWKIKYYKGLGTSTFEKKLKILRIKRVDVNWLTWLSTNDRKEC